MNPLPIPYRKSVKAHQFKLNTDYIPMYQGLSPRKNLHLSTRVMYWTICVTDMYRIFSILDLKEYLYRLGILLQTTFSLDNYFLNDEMFEYVFKDGIYSFSMEDIFKNVGIQAKDDWENFIKGGWYAGGILEHLLNGNIRARMKGGAIRFRNVKVVLKADIEIEDSIKDNAEIFANDIISRIPSKLFFEVDKITVDKKKELKAREHFYYNNAPVYNKKTLKGEVKYRGMRELQQVYDKNYFKNLSDFRAFAEAMMHLAWLFANELMLPQRGGNYAVQECTSLNEKIYTDTNGDIDFRRIRRVFKLKNIESIIISNQN